MTLEKLMAVSFELYSKYTLPHDLMKQMNECLKEVCLMEYGEDAVKFFFEEPVDENDRPLQEALKN